jgi:D-alanine-D-alanine ligase
MLEMLGVPYVGSGPQAHAVALDKVISKIVFRQHNIPTPDFWFFNSPNEDMSEVRYPVIVKPKMESVSMGLRIVDNPDDLRAAVAFVIDSFQQAALVEQFIAGGELAVGLLGNGLDLEVLPVVEFDFLGDTHAIQTQEDKMHKPVEKVCPARIPESLNQELRNLARRAFQVLDLNDFARIDVRTDTDGNPYVLEINSMASLGQTGSYCKAASVAGYSYDALVNRMLQVAAVRYFGHSFEEDDEAQATQPLRIKMRSYARSNLATTIDALRDMVAMNSYVYNTEGVNALGSWLSRRLARLGFHQQVFPQTEVGNTLYFANHEEEQNDILLLGHLDTPYRYQDYTPFREERGRLYGSGVAESKGGLAVMLTALQSLRFTRRLRRVRCGILLTADDTLGGRYNRRLIGEHAARSNYVAGLKYGDRNGGIAATCSGSASFTFELTNVKGAELPDVIKTACQKMVAWQNLTDGEAGILIKPTLLEARTVKGFTPDYASGALTVQFREREQGEYIDKRLRQIGNRGLANRFNLRLRRNVYRSPIVASEINGRFFSHVEGIGRRLEIRIASAHRNTPSDICYVPASIPALEGFGPLGGDTQTRGEFVIRDSLVDRSALLAMVIRMSAEKFA